MAQENIRKKPTDNPLKDSENPQIDYDLGPIDFTPLYYGLKKVQILNHGHSYPFTTTASFAAPDLASGTQATLSISFGLTVHSINIIDGGSNHEIGDIYFIYNTNNNNDTFVVDHAMLKVTQVDNNGSITGFRIIKSGNNFNNSNFTTLLSPDATNRVPATISLIPNKFCIADAQIVDNGFGYAYNEQSTISAKLHFVELNNYGSGEMFLAIGNIINDGPIFNQNAQPDPVSNTSRSRPPYYDEFGQLTEDDLSYMNFDSLVDTDNTLSFDNDLIINDDPNTPTIQYTVDNGNNNNNNQNANLPCQCETPNPLLEPGGIALIIVGFVSATYGSFWLLDQKRRYDAEQAAQKFKQRMDQLDRAKTHLQTKMFGISKDITDTSISISSFLNKVADKMSRDTIRGINEQEIKETFKKLLRDYIQGLKKQYPVLQNIGAQNLTINGWSELAIRNFFIPEIERVSASVTPVQIIVDGVPLYPDIDIAIRRAQKLQQIKKEQFEKLISYIRGNQNRLFPTETSKKKVKRNKIDWSKIEIPDPQQEICVKAKAKGKIGGNAYLGLFIGGLVLASELFNGATISEAAESAVDVFVPQSPLDFLPLPTFESTLGDAEIKPEDGLLYPDYTGEPKWGNPFNPDTLFFNLKWDLITEAEFNTIWDNQKFDSYREPNPLVSGSQWIEALTKQQYLQLKQQFDSQISQKEKILILLRLGLLIIQKISAKPCLDCSNIPSITEEIRAEQLAIDLPTIPLFFIRPEEYPELLGIIDPDEPVAYGTYGRKTYTKCFIPPCLYESSSSSSSSSEELLSSSSEDFIF